MFDLDRLFKRDMWKARRDLRVAEEEAESEIQAAKQKGLEGVDLEAVIHFAREDEQLAWERLAKLVTHKRLDQARKLMVPIPPRPPRGEDNEFWGECVDWSGQYLTYEGMIQLRRAIREEKSARYEPFFKWGGLILGAIGSVSGLLAIIGVRLL